MSQPLAPSSQSLRPTPSIQRLLQPLGQRASGSLTLRALTLTTIVMASGCSGTGFTDLRPADPGPELRLEQWEGGGLRIEPSGVVAELAGDRAVNITVDGTALRAGDGAFVVELRSLDNVERVAADRAFYSLPAVGAQAQWTVHLELPAAVERPEQLVRYNVVVSTIEGGLWWTRSLVDTLPFDGSRADEAESPWRAFLLASREQLEPFMEPLRESLVANLSHNLEVGLEEMDRRGCPPQQYCERLDADYFPAMRRELARLHPLRDYWGNLYRNEPSEPSEIARLVSAGPDEIMGSSDDLTIAIDYAELDFSAAGLSESSALEHGPQPSAE